jgi:hypothetical protein
MPNRPRSQYRTLVNLRWLAVELEYDGCNPDLKWLWVYLPCWCISISCERR